MKMRILLVGNGAREHAIAEAICTQDVDLYAYMSRKNPGISRLCKDYALGDILDASAVSKWAGEHAIDLAIVGPEAPLEAGVVDALEKREIQVSSPNKSAARLETDKAFTRGLMERYKIPGLPKFSVLETEAEVDEFVSGMDMEVAVKPAGLTGGKGVKIMREHLKNKEEVREYAKEIIRKGVGTINKVVMEERLVGEEFTLQAFVSPEEIVGMPMVQDHKRAYEGDRGPNTGGMGSYSNRGYILPFLKKADYEFAIDIMRKTVRALYKDTGDAYKGVLYGQFIATADGIKVIEFNARFGDPEAMNVLSIFEGNFVEVMETMINGGLKSADFHFIDQATVCKYLVPSGYPINPEKGAEIIVDEAAVKQVGARLHYASVSEEGGKIFTTSSRAISLTGVAPTIEKAEEIAESAIPYVKGPLEHRRDIGTQELVEKRIRHMKELRNPS